MQSEHQHRCASMAAPIASNLEIEIVSALEHLIAPQPYLAISDEFARAQLELVAVPRADDMKLVAERLPEHGLLLFIDQVFDPTHHQAFARRSAAMWAVVAVRIKDAVL